MEKHYEAVKEILDDQIKKINKKHAEEKEKKKKEEEEKGQQLDLFQEVNK